MLDTVGALNVTRAQFVVDVFRDPVVIGAPDEGRTAHLVAAVLQDAVEADAAAGRVCRNRGGHDGDFRLQHVVEVTLRRTFIALNRHALDQLFAVHAAQPVSAQPHLLGHVRPADVGRVRPHAGRQNADRHDVARHRQRVDDVARDVGDA